MLDLDRYDRREAKHHYDETYVDDDFHQFPIATQHFLRAFLAHHDVPAGVRALDVGCGTGGFVERLQTAGVDAVGIDISEVGVATARDAHGDCEFVLGDALSRPFPERSFELVTANGFSPLSEPDVATARPVVSELLEYLREDGLLLVGYTSRLTDDYDGGWTHHSMDAFDRLFRRVDAAVVGRYATVPHLFIPLGRRAFSPALTAALRRSARTLGHPVRLYYALRPEP